MRGTRLQTVAAILAGMLAGGSLMAVAYAHGGNTSLVHSCVNKTSGTLRIVAPSATCKSWERPLDWGIQGPQGIQGIQGEPGEGTSVYYASGVAQNAVSITGGPYQPNAWGIEVLKLELPAGKFLVNGDISVVGSLSLQPAQAVLVSCNILGGTYTVGDSTDESLYGVGQVAIGQRYGSSSTSTMSLTAAGVLTGPGLVSIRCMAALLGEPTPSNRELAIANLPTLSATRVSALEVQGV